MKDKINWNLQQRRTSEAKTTHGCSGTSMYNVWKNMIARCHDPSHPAYKNYGAVGIHVFEEWRLGPTDFIEYVMGLENYNKIGYSLDRIDPSKCYIPNNIRWTNRHIQNVNQRIRDDNKSGYKGVSFYKRTSKWVSYIKVKGRQFRLGYYETSTQAAEARDWFIIKNGLWEYKLQIITQRA